MARITSLFGVQKNLLHSTATVFFRAGINQGQDFFLKKAGIFWEEAMLWKRCTVCWTYPFVLSLQSFFVVVSQPQIERFRSYYFFMRCFRDMEGERAPLVYDTVHTDVTAMHLDVFLCNREREPNPVVLAA